MEDLYKSVEKIEVRIEDMMHNKVNIEFVTKQLEKALEDIEQLKSNLTGRVLTIVAQPTLLMM